MYDGDFTGDLSTMGGVTYLKHDDPSYAFTQFWLLGNAHCAVQTNTDEAVRGMSNYYVFSCYR